MTDDETAADPADDAYPLPELTRALRAFGSGRALPGADHDRYFAPLVVPLRALRARHDRETALGNATGESWRAAEAIDAPRAAAEVRATLAALAAERHPAAAADRRALEAELLDEADDLLASLDALGAAATRLRDAGDDDRPAAWRAWAASLAAAFAAADRSWARSLAALAEAPVPVPRSWGRTPRPKR